MLAGDSGFHDDHVMDVGLRPLERFPDVADEVDHAVLPFEHHGSLGLQRSTSCYECSHESSIRSKRVAGTLPTGGRCAQLNIARDPVKSLLQHVLASHFAPG